MMAESVCDWASDLLCDDEPQYFPEVDREEVQEISSFVSVIVFDDKHFFSQSRN